MNIEFPKNKLKEIITDSVDTDILEPELNDVNNVHTNSLDFIYEKENEKIVKNRNFEEYKEKIKKDIEEKESEADNLLENLSSIDFNNQEVLLDWLCEFKDTQASGVISDKNKAIDIFNKNDYRIISSKLDKNFIDDKGKYARYIIGKGLYEIFMDIPSQDINNCVKQWKEKFSDK